MVNLKEGNKRILLILPMDITLGERYVDPMTKMFADQAEELTREGWEVTIVCSYNSKSDKYNLIQPKNEFDNYLDQERQIINQMKNHLDRFDIIHSHTPSQQIYALPNADKLPLCATFHMQPHNLPSLLDTPCFIGGSMYLSDYVNMYMGTYCETINDTIKRHWFDHTVNKMDYFLYDGEVKGNALLEVIQLSKHHRIYLIGDDCTSLALQLKSIISYYEILGKVSIDIERLLYHASKYLINSSTLTGLPYIQAMLSGTPIIDKRSKLNEEFVNELSGYLYDTKEEVIDYLSNEHKPVDSYVLYNKRFNFDMLFEEQLNLYERIIAQDKW